MPKKPQGRRRSSSNVASHEYSPETGHLTVKFHSGRTYRYEGVSPRTAQNLADAPSKGAFLHAHIVGKHNASEI